MSLHDELAQALEGAAQLRGVRVRLKTNLGPAVTVYDADAPPPSFPLRLRAGVIIEDREGRRIASAGGWPATDWPLVIALGALALGGAALVVRGVLR